MSAPRKARGSDASWFSAGLRFACTRCGACCSGEPGVVWVTHDEIEGIAAFLDMTPQECARSYLRQVGDRVSLRETGDGDCVFLTRPDNGCMIYPVRPTQCRSYPFWPASLRAESAWRTEAGYCPGVGRGRRTPADTCARKAAVTRHAERRTARRMP